MKSPINSETPKSVNLSPEDVALAHVGDFRVTDIYAERNWELTWEALDKVLALFDFGQQHVKNCTKKAPRTKPRSQTLFHHTHS